MKKQKDIYFEDVVKNISKKEKDVLKHFFKNKKILIIPNKKINNILKTNKNKNKNYDNYDNYLSNIRNLNNLMRFNIIPKFELSLYTFNDKIDNEMSSFLPSKTDELNKNNFKNIKKNIIKSFDSFLQKSLSNEIKNYTNTYNKLIQYGNDILKNTLLSNNKLKDNITVFRAFDININPLETLELDINNQYNLRFNKFNKGNFHKKDFQENFIKYKTGSTFEDMGISTFSFNPFNAIHNNLNSGCCLLRLTLNKNDKYFLDSYVSKYLMYSKSNSPIKYYQDNLEIFLHPCQFIINDIIVINPYNKGDGMGLVMYDLSINKYLKVEKLKKLKLKL